MFTKKWYSTSAWSANWKSKWVSKTDVETKLVEVWVKDWGEGASCSFIWYSRASLEIQWGGQSEPNGFRRPPVIKLSWIIWSSQYSFQWEYWAIHLPEWGHSDKFSNYQNVLLQNVDSLVLWKIQHFRSDCEFCKCRTAARTGWSLAWVKLHLEAGSRWICRLCWELWRLVPTNRKINGLQKTLITWAICCHPVQQ